MHWMAVKRIFRYLKGTADKKLAFRKQADHFIHGYTDADWAADVDERKSCTGYVFIRSGCAITWNSKRQQTVALRLLQKPNIWHYPQLRKKRFG